MKSLRNKNAILTGGSRGLGPFIARALVREGVNLALAARSAAELDLIAQELKKTGAHVIAIPTDVTIESERAALLRRIEEELGQTDILINNAAIGHFARFERQDESDMIRIIDTNLVAPMLLTREVLPGMLERAHGHVVNIASLAGKRGIPYEAAYAGSKAGLIQWSNALGMELEGTGVDVSVMCPVYVSGAGMFAVHGVPAPRLAGSISPQRVASAVIAALHKGTQEVIVRPGPTRPLYALNELSPRIGRALLKLMGVISVQRRLADRGEPPTSPPAAEHQPCRGA